MFDEINAILQSWKRDEPILAILFKQREKEKVKVYMIKYIEKFKDALLLLNAFKKETKPFQQLIPDFNYKPINLEERLAFMELRPNHYHSFIQLKECFQELEKLEAKAIIKEGKK